MCYFKDSWPVTNFTKFTLYSDIPYLTRFSYVFASFEANKEEIQTVTTYCPIKFYQYRCLINYLKFWIRNSCLKTKQNISFRVQRGTWVRHQFTSSLRFLVFISLLFSEVIFKLSQTVGRRTQSIQYYVHVWIFNFNFNLFYN